MQTLMLRLDRLLRRRQKLFLALWLVALVAALPFAARQEDHLTGGGWEAGGSESVAVKEAIESRFPDSPSATNFYVLVPHRDARPGDLSAAVRTVDGKVAQVPEGRIAPAARREALASARARPDQPVVIPLPVRGGDTQAIDLAKDLRTELGIEADKAGVAADGRVDVHVGGQGGLWAAFQAVNKEDGQKAESRGLPIIAIVLLLAFGSAAAAALPFLLGVAAVVVTFAIIFAISLSVTMSVFVSSMASMLGIGVAVDYSLFVLARYREEVRAGRSPDQARATALATSGVAVLFSGLTVIVSLAALFLIDSPALRSMAAGPIIVVAVSMLGASTLLPVLIRMLGRRAYEPGRVGRALERRRARRREGAAAQGFWERWTGAVMARPVLSVVAALAVLLTLALPALDLKVSNSATGQLDSENETRRGTEAAAAVVGPGALGPTLVVLDFGRGSAREAANRATLRRVRAAIRRDPAVRSVGEQATSKDQHLVKLNVVLRVNPESDAARDAVSRLRESLPAVAGASAQAEVGGTTAILDDFDDLVAGSLWKIILFVLVFSLVVLIVLLRSIVLPLKAVLMNVLSVTAAYGVLVAAFQWGWLSFLGLDKSSEINTGTPPLVLVIAFGLSMDYEVFMLTRIRERYAISGDNTRAVAQGLATSAATITSAALIMVAVFLSFVSAGVPSLQQIGLASAVAIAIDATIVRLVLVPAAMKLFGRWNWWLPRPLARILPTTNLEHLRQVLEPNLAPAHALAGADGGTHDHDGQPKLEVSDVTPDETAERTL